MAMADERSKEIQVKEKRELSGPSEQTKPGPIFTPDVDIFESDKDITLLADIPGVTPENLNIDLRENTLTIIGEVPAYKGAEEQELITEYETGKYYRQFSLSEVVDQNKIDAKMSEGVLRLRLPKVEKAKPRRIEVKAA
jgi:HSP20 family molecular chaperone IbpA